MIIFLNLFYLLFEGYSILIFMCDVRNIVNTITRRANIDYEPPKYYIFLGREYEDENGRCVLNRSSFSSLCLSPSLSSFLFPVPSFLLLSFSPLLYSFLLSLFSFHFFFLMGGRFFWEIPYGNSRFLSEIFIFLRIFHYPIWISSSHIFHDLRHKTIPEHADMRGNPLMMQRRTFVMPAAKTEYQSSNFDESTKTKSVSRLFFWIRERPLHVMYRRPPHMGTVQAGK